MSNDNDHKGLVYLVNWKQEQNHVEIFSGLEVFAASYPRYDLQVLKDAFAFGRTVFEDEAVHITKKWITGEPKPDFPPVFFWDFQYDTIDWRANFRTVIQRVLERGFENDWKELARYYGKDTIINTLKEYITFLPDECIDEASLFFNLNKEDMLCYKRKLSQTVPWL